MMFNRSKHMYVAQAAELAAGDGLTVQPLQPQKISGRKKREKIPLIEQIIHCLIVLVLAMGAYWFVSRHVLQAVQVEGRSMYPTLRESETYFLNRWIYGLRDPKRSEIVVLKDPKDSVFEVKRVIATAGESVYFKKGLVYVNGKLLDEPYLSPGTKTYPVSETDELICCGRDQFFVLGDNRPISYDSRYFGPVRRGQILGRLVR